MCDNSNDFNNNDNDEMYIKRYLKYKNKYLKLKELEKKMFNTSNMTGGSVSEPTKPSLSLFKAEWCGHCQAFKNTWAQLSNDRDYKNKVKFVTYDSEKNKDEMSQFGIDGFPTLILNINNKAVEYSGPRDINSLKQFINKYINN